jgi:hypothetical protein
MSLAGSGLDIPPPREDGDDAALRLFFERARKAELSGAGDVTLLELAGRKGSQ